MDDPNPPLIPLSVSIDDSHSRLSRDTTYTLTNFPKNPLYNSTVPLFFETYVEDIYTIPLIREHQTSNFYYIDTHSLIETPDEPSFSVPFTSHLNSTETFCKNIYPTNVYIRIAHVFTTLLKNFSEKNNLLPQQAFTTSGIQALLQKKAFLTFLTLNNSALLKINPAISSQPIIFKSITSDVNFAKISL